MSSIGNYNFGQSTFGSTMSSTPFSLAANSTPYGQPYSSFACTTTTSSSKVVPMEGVTHTGVSEVFKPQSEDKICELVAQLADINPKLVNWKNVSSQKMSDFNLDILKHHLNWEIVSKKVSLETATKFKEYVDWDLFIEEQEAEYSHQMRLKVSAILEKKP